MRYLFVFTKTYAVCLENLTSQNDREVARRTTANITCSSLNPRSATCFDSSKTSKECPEANRRTCDHSASPPQGIEHHETNQRQPPIFHRTNAGAPSHQTPRRRLVVRGQARRLSGIGLLGRQCCAAHLAQPKAAQLSSAARQFEIVVGRPRDPGRRNRCVR
jgi:hypothetical protein